MDYPPTESDKLNKLLKYELLSQYRSKFMIYVIGIFFCNTVLVSMMLSDKIIILLGLVSCILTLSIAPKGPKGYQRHIFLLIGAKSFVALSYISYLCILSAAGFVISPIICIMLNLNIASIITTLVLYLSNSISGAAILSLFAMIKIFSRTQYTFFVAILFPIVAPAMLVSKVALDTCYLVHVGIAFLVSTTTAIICLYMSWVIAMNI